mgnify:FL=1
MSWIISNPFDTLVLAWNIGLKYCVILCAMMAAIAFLISRSKKTHKGKITRRTICLMLIVSTAICGCRAYSYLNPNLGLEQNHEYYAVRFNDIQGTQIVAARKYGITPLKDRVEAKNLIKEGQLKRVRSCKNYQLAPMGHSMPYLTNNADELLNDIGSNFQDSLGAKGMSNYKIVVTSILRTDDDVARLMKRNSVAVRNSAHRHATTFDISCTQFVPAGLIARTDSGELKKVLAEVLNELRNDKRCYVKYEKSQNCFHITVRK